MLRFLLITMSILLLNSCATVIPGPLEDARYLRDTPLVIGKLCVLINGEDYTQHCNLYFNSINSKKYAFNPEEDGFIAIRLRPDENRISKIEFYDYKYNLLEECIYVDLINRPLIQYIGNITIHWDIPNFEKFDRTMAPTAVPPLDPTAAGLIGSMAVGAAAGAIGGVIAHYDCDGKIRIEIEDDFNNIKEECLMRYGERRVMKNLMHIATSDELDYIYY